MNLKNFVKVKTIINWVAKLRMLKKTVGKLRMSDKMVWKKFFYLPNNNSFPELCTKDGDEIF